MVNFRPIGGPKKYFKYSECEEGQELVTGTYVGRSPNKFGNENYDFDPLDGGPTVALNHAGHLAYLIDNYVTEGEVVKVVYKGKVELTTGAMAGKSAHNFEIFKAQEDSPTQTEMPLESEQDPDEISISDLT